MCWGCLFGRADDGVALCVQAGGGMSALQDGRGRPMMCGHLEGLPKDGPWDAVMRCWRPAMGWKWARWLVVPLCAVHMEDSMYGGGGQDRVAGYVGQAWTER